MATGMLPPCQDLYGSRDLDVAVNEKEALPI